MWHMRVRWIHDYADEPVELFSEVGADGYECRKVERFRDGRLQWADEHHEFPDTCLGEVPVGTLAEINEQDEFEGVLITAAEFERVWRQAVDS